jgi:arylsulfatase A-like enzyme
MIASLDESTGRVMQTLEEMGIAENTIVVFFSDNGGYGPATSMAPLRGSKGTLYEGGIRVPFAIHAPAILAEPRRDDTPIIGTDLYPTVLEIAGATAPPAQPLDGASLWPLLTESTPLPPRALFWHFPAYLEAYAGTTSPWRTTPAAAIRQGDYKLVEFFEDGRLELYNLRDDVGEINNVAEAMPGTVEALHTLMKAWRDSVGAPVPTEPNPAYEPNSAPD